MNNWYERSIKALQLNGLSKGTQATPHRVMAAVDIRHPVPDQVPLGLQENPLPFSLRRHVIPGAAIEIKAACWRTSARCRSQLAVHPVGALPLPQRTMT